eukprot:4824000-Prymnesium_polylepis.2
MRQRSASAVYDRGTLWYRDEGSASGWRRRHIALAANALQWFDDEDGEDAGEIALFGAQVLPLESAARLSAEELLSIQEEVRRATRGKRITVGGALSRQGPLIRHRQWPTTLTSMWSACRGGAPRRPELTSNREVTCKL